MALNSPPSGLTRNLHFAPKHALVLRSLHARARHNAGHAGYLEVVTSTTASTTSAFALPLHAACFRLLARDPPARSSSSREVLPAAWRHLSSGATTLGSRAWAPVWSPRVLSGALGHPLFVPLGLSFSLRSVSCGLRSSRLGNNCV